MFKSSHARQVLDAMNTAVLTCDRDLNITAMNSAAENLFGVSNRQMIGKPVDCLVCGEGDTLSALLRKAIDGEHAITAHDLTVAVGAGQALTTDLSATPVNPTGLPYRLIVELIQVDRFLRLAREESRVDRHAANRAVLRGLAHEIKNPLGGLRGAAQLLDRELGDRDLREYTRIIIHEADRLRNLVDRMVGSHRPIEYRLINIHEVLEHVRKLIQVEVPEGISIHRDYDPSLPEMMGDREQLIQAVLNVVRNAIEALQGKGRVGLHTRIERSVYIEQRWHRHAIRVDIVDNGPGIPSDLKEHIFYPMVTGRAEGSGLGLSITQDIVHKHGGLIELKSRPGHTRFTLLLPITDENEAHEQ